MSAAQTVTLRVALLAAACAVSLHSGELRAATQQPAAVTAARVAEALNEAGRERITDATFAEVVSIANALVAESRFDEAATLFVALVERRPHDPAALYGASLATFNAGRATQAEPLARRAVAAALSGLKNPINKGKGANALRMHAADALVLFAVVVAVRGDANGALKAVERAVQLAPKHFDAQLALGRARFGTGDAAGAVRAFRAAVALNPADARARFFLATALEDDGDTEGALNAYRELTARQPSAAEGHLGLGVLLIKRGGAEAEAGLAELRRALEINPDLYEARVTLGRALVARGRAAESVEHLRRAAELAPGVPEPHYQLSLAYRRLGRREEAAAESAIVRQIHETRRAGGARIPAPIIPD